VILRPATLADARSIADVHVLTWQAAYRGIVPNAYLESLSVESREAAWREMVTRKAPEIWVAQTEGSVTGFVSFGPSRDSDRVPSTGELEAIYVLPAYWGTGVGVALWRVAQRRLTERHFTSVTLWVLKDNARAIRFYSAAGFLAQPFSEKEISRGGKSLREIRYVREQLTS
jgi:ribosomal protein S18 acetylase RimI-like enzyme